MPILVLIQDWHKHHSCSIGLLMCYFCQKWKAVPKYGTVPFLPKWNKEPKLAETALLFHRVTNMEQWAKVGRDHFLPIMAHFKLIQNWQKQHCCSIGRLTCHFC